MDWNSVFIHIAKVESIILGQAAWAGGIFFPDWENSYFTRITFKILVVCYIHSFNCICDLRLKGCKVQIWKEEKHMFWAERKIGELDYGGKETFSSPSRFLQKKSSGDAWRNSAGKLEEQTLFPNFLESSWVTEAYSV